MSRAPRSSAGLPRASLLDDRTETWRGAALADARENFADFCALIDIPQAPPKAREAQDDEGDDARYPPIRREEAAHITLLQDTLQKVESGEIPRLMVFMPPGGAKSTYGSVCFPPWFLGRAPGRNVILTTYASGLARKMGRRARGIVKQSIYRDLFGQGLSKEASAADEWSLDGGGEYLAGGIRQGITGHRADLIVIDDPIKGREEADSQAIRDRTWEEFRDTLRTRLKPGGRIVIIQTRWHEDDLAGRLLPEDYDGESGEVAGRDGETWNVLCLPAEADRDDDPLHRKRGEMFWPQWFPADHWAAYRAEPRTWASLYQQKPRPDDGGYFLRSWFPRFRPEQTPRALRYVITSDYATRDGAGDHTCHLVWGIDNAMHAWLIQAWRAQTTSDVWIEALIDLIADYRAKGGGPVRCIGEKGVIMSAISPALTVRMRERRIHARMELYSPHTGDKSARARGFQALAREGRIHIADDMDGDVFIEELIGFPAARWDDQVDAAGLLGRAFDRLGGGGVPHQNRPQFAEGGVVW